MNKKIKLMSHLVAGYPTDDLAFTAAKALVDGGADILEVQLPFSDPSADGPAIQTACTEVLSRSYKTADGLAFIKKVHEEFPETTIYIMSYGSLVYTPGVDEFCKKASECGVKGMIIPDLPFDHDEGLTVACKKYGMENIPVAAPSMSDERLSKLANAGYNLICTVRKEEDKIALENLSDKIECVYLDVTKEDEVKNLFYKLKENNIELIGIINNAGYAVSGLMEEPNIEKIKQQIEVNSFAPLRVATTMLPLMKKGKIINMSSVSSNFVYPFITPYCASKRLLDTLFQGLTL